MTDRIRFSPFTKNDRAVSSRSRLLNFFDSYESPHNPASFYLQGHCANDSTHCRHDRFKHTHRHFFVGSRATSRPGGRLLPTHTHAHTHTQALFRVLKAYSLHDLEVGYCQGMAFAAGIILMYLPQVRYSCCIVRRCGTVVALCCVALAHHRPRRTQSASGVMTALTCAYQTLGL
jgi:hypothetical protein